MTNRVIWLDKLSINDVDVVGGKNASLGEMISGLASAHVSVPGGFATTAEAFREFLQQDDLAKRINDRLKDLDTDDVNALARAGSEIRSWVIDTPLPAELKQEVIDCYASMQSESGTQATVAVRSSATAEDLPEASFAGQQETYLNVTGIDNVITAIKHVFASLYNDRAISYRVHQNFEHERVALSAGIQRMVRSDIGASGVMFTLDTESGFRDAVFITAAYGLGETVVQGAVNPDEFYVYKPGLAQNRPAILRRNLGSKTIKMVHTDKTEHGESIQTVPVHDDERNRFCITDEQVEELAQQAVIIEQHYGRPMDIEWALDGEDNQLYIVQARPETVESRNVTTTERYELKETGTVLAQGRAIGQRVGAGTIKLICDVSEMDRVEEGDILVTGMTDPDWEPIMKRAAAIITDRGGRTCHAAIIAREMGIPAIVGCGNATEVLVDGTEATASCAEGDTGLIYEGILDFEIVRTDTGEMPKLPTKIMMNVANPGRAFAFAQLPNAGIGLARLEFIINNTIGIHPRALLDYQHQPEELKAEIDQRMYGYKGPVEFYIDKLTEGVASLAAAFAPNPVIVRLSDFKSNEYANLLGGRQFEPEEENPMIGFRGASRYLSEEFRESFELECIALKRVRDEMGLTNVEIMVPFCRTVEQAGEVIEVLKQNGLVRGENGLRIIMMCEIPSNALLADEFLEYFDGFSIGSNDMTQLTLGLDRDSALISDLFDERNPAVKKILAMAIKACREKGKYVGICGQGPSDYPDFAAWLFDQGISSISLNPDTVVDTWVHLAEEHAE